MRFGKHPPIIDYRTLRFKKYLLSTIAPPPVSFDVLTKVKAQTGIQDIATLFCMDGNDQYGDCTIAALAHAITVFDGLIGLKKMWSVNDVTKVYFKLTEGVDSGLNELDVLNYWKTRYRDKILGYVSIDVKNIEHVKQAIQIFGGVYLGFQVTDNIMDQFNNGQAWTPGNLTNDGHAVFATAYDQDTITVLTWGAVQKGTWAWFSECVDEAYAILPVQAIQPNFAIGFNFDQLKSDLNDLSN
jgi:hypothetical protein